MSYSTPASSSVATASRSRRKKQTWASAPVGNTARGRLEYIDCCVNSILQNTNASEQFRVYHSPFRPGSSSTSSTSSSIRVRPSTRRSNNAKTSVTVSGTQQRWFPCCEGVNIQCAFCEAAVPSKDAASHTRNTAARVLKNVYVRPAWTLACGRCAAKISPNC